MGEEPIHYIVIPLKEMTLKQYTASYFHSSLGVHEAARVGVQVVSVLLSFNVVFRIDGIA